MHWSPGLHGLLRSPAIPPSLSVHECGAAGSASHHLVGSASFSLACPVSQSATSLSPPATALLRVLSAPAASLCPSYHSVRMFLLYLLGCRTSCSSGCFLFLNCCCPSFGCGRRHSVSTYASIFAGPT